ncbi:kinesin-like protein KIF12 isoform X2 [Photinus pyralis]|uniref:kinesin-like protein KIF12 isoform X2 n=1 Tax=Photinus pyralis TaxID=7054 RepID=UPI0012675A3F|nr:kinesin-like protein KIF12 isoform X2 [Photinus pyralis]
MMVIRGGKGTPPNSRGNSPLRETFRKNARASLDKSQTFRSPNRRVPQANGTERRAVRSRGNSPGNQENGVAYLSSRGSETGSIERLDDTGHSHRIISGYNQVEDNINVVVRVRPLNHKEVKARDISVIQFPGNGQILVEHLPNGGSAHKSKLFSYNVVFEPAATQEDVLQFSGIKRLIEMAVEGFRCTAFCYGQTGSGKTHTLTGPPKLFDKKKPSYSDAHGLVFRSFMYLFKLLNEKSDVSFILKASFLEIYNEKVIDLLNPGSARKPLAVRWSKKARGFFVENLFTVDCEELDDLTAVLEEGMRNRSVGSHNMNDYSSRSHTILTVHITSEQPAENGVFISRSGKINFVDLAGSEMTKKTQSEGKTLEEANNINKSLMVLGYCIASLSDNKRRNNHIPYRDSQLTKLLADSLAGNGVTLMIACISPAMSNLCETINTLRYAARAKRIRTKPIVLMDPREALILTLKREVGVLQSENEHLRTALHLQGSPSESLGGKRSASSVQVDLDKLGELEGPQLIDLVKLYVAENEALRKENTELFVSREILMRDQELVCRDNERLLKKLEEVNSVCCRSPLLPVKTSASASTLNRSFVDLDLSATNIWINPTENSLSSSMGKITLPEVIQKELDKRQIGASAHRRHNSLEDLSKAVNNPVRAKSSKSANPEDLDIRPPSGRRFSMAKPTNGRAHVDSPQRPETPASLASVYSSEWNLDSPSPTKQEKLDVGRQSKGSMEVFGSPISVADDRGESDSFLIK